jgi:hypothetical protein
MRSLLDEYRAGRLRPVDVRLGEMPPGATPLMRLIAEEMRLRMGLRLAVDDDRSLPYATSEAVRSKLTPHKMQASRAIRGLVAAGVIEGAGCLPRRPGGPPDGTRLYRPPAAVLQRDAVVVEVADCPPVEPTGELVDEGRVDGAVLRSGGHAVGVVAPGNSAADAGSTHSPEDTPLPGRLSAPITPRHPPPDNDPRSPDDARWLRENALIAAIVESFDATEEWGERVGAPTQERPCRYRSHEATYWRKLVGGPVQCGVCHPAVVPHVLVPKQSAR